MSYFSEFTVNTKKFINRHKNGLTKVVSTLLLLLLLPATTVLAISAEDQAKLDQIAAENSALKEKLNALYAQENTLENEIAIAEAQAAGLQAQINSTQTKISVANSQIAETEASIATAEANLARQNEILKEYLKVIYMEGQTSEIELILTSNSFSEFVDQTEYLNNIQQNVSTTIDEITATKAKLEADKLALETTKAGLLSLRAGLADQQLALRDQIAFREQLLTSNQSNQSDLDTQMAENNSRSAIIRYLAAGGGNAVADGDLLVVNQSTPTISYQTQKISGSYDGGYHSFFYYGCLITSLSMLHGLTPQQEASNHTYVQYYNGTYHHDGYMNSDSTSGRSAGGWSGANGILNAGGAVIFGLDFNQSVDSDGDGIKNNDSDHFVVAISYDPATGKYLINDPYFSIGKAYDSSQVVKWLKA